MRHITRLFTVLLLSVLLAAGLSLRPAKAAGTVDGVTFVRRSWNGSSVASEDASRDGVTPVPSSGAMTSGWYYLNSNVTVNGRINLTGNTWLILGDGYKLDVKGLFIPENCTLTIYGQKAGSGQINSHPSTGAAIGGKTGANNGEIIIHGGVITATGAKNCAGIGTNDGKNGGAITIYGGTITAKGGSNGAGIGGGDDRDGGTIKIYGGTITAKGGGDGAGIGGGDDGDGGNITIWGGTVTAHSDCENSAAIGGGNDADGGVITIHGGKVYAYSRDGAGIGGGEDGDGGIIRITGGEVHADPADGSKGNAAAIGGGNHSGKGGSITVSGGTVYANGKNGAGLGGGRAANGGISQSDNNSGAGGTIVISGGTVNATSNYYAIGAGGQQGDNSDKIIPYDYLIGSAGNITIKGSAHVIAHGEVAGIGGDSGTVNIQAGTVEVGGSESKNTGTGIMLQGSKSQVNITGGTVTAVGYGKAAGLTTLYGKTTITGGTVEATANGTGAGIGGWNYDDILHANGTLEISGTEAFVKAVSTDLPAIGERDDDLTFLLRAGITVETWSKGKHHDDANLFYEGARFKAGADPDSAAILASADRKSAYKNRNLKFIRVEPCDHSGTMSNGKCTACGYSPYAVSSIERSWDETQVTTEKVWHDNVTPFPNSKSVSAGWYVVNTDITISGRVSLGAGETHLILGDGKTLKVNGLYVPRGSTLYIYGQDKCTGKLISTPSDGAGIGGYSGNLGGNIVIHSGIVEATGADHCAGIGSNDGQGTGTGSFTMYGGTVTATGGSQSAGIGGGSDSDGGVIKIYGGTVTATGRDSSAGIGGSDASGSRADSSTIEIYGGTITATGKSKGAGIGGGEYGHAEILISGGTITATGGSSGGAGIGNGVDGSGGSVTILGGTVTAEASSGGCGIGKGKSSSSASVTLGYTEATQDSISITASSFGGTVTLEQPFYNANARFSTDVQDAGSLSAMAGSTLRAWDAQINVWTQLQRTINATPDGGLIRLNTDITAGSEDSALQIVGKSVTIDLHGHTLDRGLNEAKANGYVIYIASGAELILLDSENSGVITGGYNTGSGGGIYCAGTMTIRGGTITGNESLQWGGGVYLPNGTGALLHMQDGYIRNNICGKNGGGVHVSESAGMTVSVAPVVRNNRKKAEDGTLTANNVALSGSAVIGVSGELTEFTDICVTRSAGPGIITGGYRTNNEVSPDTFFHADRDDLIVVLSQSEACLDTPAAGIRFNTYKWSDALIRTANETDNEWARLPAEAALPGGKYVLDRDITMDGRMSFEGDTWLVLCDGMTLDVKGLSVPADSTLVLCAESEGTGKILSHPAAGAGIDSKGGSIVIHGGTVVAEGGSGCAGIGSSDGDPNVTVYHGTVTATGGNEGAGIGGGRNSAGGNIRIYGGTVTANAGSGSAAIGGGSGGDGGSITILGGSVTAGAAGSSGTGIGGGSGSSGAANITLSYTDDTMNSVQIASDGYSGPVTLDRPFSDRDTGNFFDAAQYQPEQLAGRTLIPYTGENPSISILISGNGSANAKYGNTTVTTAVPGNPITLALVPAEGYYVHSVTLDGDELLPDAEGAYSFPMKNGPVTVAVLFRPETPWSALQGQIFGDSQEITLTGNVSASAEDRALYIPEGKTLTLNLAGYKLDRGLGAGDPQAYGYVIRNDGVLTVADSAGGGIITGGHHAGSGGGIVNNGTLTLLGGEISGNKATGSGGGIDNNGILNISDSPDVKDNTAPGGNNIFLRSGHPVMNIEEELIFAELWVTAQSDTGVITSGYGYGSVNTQLPNAFFFPDSEDCGVILTDTGEAELTSETVTVFFDGGSEGSGTMEPVSLVVGSVFQLPDCEFESGADFREWSVRIGTAEAVVMNPDDEITVTENTIISALWDYTVFFALGDIDAEGDMDPVRVTAGTVYTLPPCEFTLSGAGFAAWESDFGRILRPGEEIPMTAGITLTPVWKHAASFILPDSATVIEESAFEGDAGIRTADAKNCGFIGANAFADCGYLSEIQLPRNCEIDPSAFANCGTVYVFAPADGTTEAFCASREFLIFVELR